MSSCHFCKVDPKKQLLSCVCKKVSYCSKECQTKDWKIHKPSCPPYIIRESSGKGRGLFATRKIKAGQVILEEYPLLVLSDVGISLREFRVYHYPHIDDETKAKILQLNDPSENLKILDAETVEKLLRKNPNMMLWKEARNDEISKIYRILNDNHIGICEKEELYNISEAGLYHNFSRVNHSCVPNTVWSWVMGDFRKHQVRAIMTIEKNEEILITYWEQPEFVYGSREFRQQKMLQYGGFLCKCSECSLEEEDLEDNERMRAEMREVNAEIEQFMRSEGPDLRRSVKKGMKLAQKRTKLVQKLNLQADVVDEMIDFYALADMARRLDISCENEPEIFAREAWKYARMFGDRFIHLYNSRAGKE